MSDNRESSVVDEESGDDFGEGPASPIDEQEVRRRTAEGRQSRRQRRRGARAAGGDDGDDDDEDYVPSNDEDDQETLDLMSEGDDDDVDGGDGNVTGQARARQQPNRAARVSDKSAKKTAKAPEKKAKSKEDMDEKELVRELGKLNRTHEKKIAEIRRRSNLSDHRSEDDYVRFEGTLQSIVSVYDRYDVTSYDRTVSQQFTDGTIDALEAVDKAGAKRKRQSKQEKIQDERKRKETMKLRYSSYKYQRALQYMTVDLDDDADFSRLYDLISPTSLIEGKQETAEESVQQTAISSESEGVVETKRQLNAMLRRYCVDPIRPSGSRYCVNFVLQVIQSTDQGKVTATTTTKVAETVDEAAKKDATTQKTAKEASAYNSDYVIREQPMFGFFDEIPLFGEYYVFLCAKDKLPSGRYRYVVQRQMYQKNSLADLDIYTLEQVYRQKLSDPDSNEVDQDFSGIVGRMRGRIERIKRNRIELARAEGKSADVDGSSTQFDLRREAFDLLDPHIAVYAEPWFESMFYASQYLQRLAIKEMSEYFNERASRLMNTCTADALYRLVMDFCTNTLSLCYWWRLPNEMCVAVLDPSELELSIESATAACTNFGIEFTQQQIEIIGYYRQVIHPIVYEKQHSFLRQKEAERLGSEMLQAMLDEQILVKRTFGARTHYYPFNEYRTQRDLLKALAKMVKRDPTLYYDSSSHDNRVALAIERVREASEQKMQVDDDDDDDDDEDEDANQEGDESGERHFSSTRAARQHHVSQDKLDALHLVAQKCLTLVSGETGSGKTYFAKLLQEMYGARDTLLVAPSTAAVVRLQQSPTLLSTAPIRAHTVLGVICAILRSRRVVKDIDEAIDVFDRQHEHSRYDLTAAERSRLEHTLVYRYFRCSETPENRRRLAILLHLAFNQRVSESDVRELVIYCNLTYKRVLVVDGAEQLDYTSMSRLLYLLPRLERCVLVANPHRASSEAGREYFFGSALEAFSPHADDDEEKKSLKRKAALVHLNNERDENRRSRQVIEALQPLVTSDDSGDRSRAIVASDVADGQSPLLIVQRTAPVSANAKTSTSPAVLVQLIERYVGGDSTRLLDDVTVFVRAKFARDKINRQLYWWQLNDWYERLRHNDPNDQFRSKLLVRQRPVSEREWRRGGVFSSLDEFRSIVNRMKRQSNYEDHHFFVGERVMLLLNHTGVRDGQLRFCPFPSERVRANTIDTIKLIFDYDPMTKSVTYRHSTYETRAHRNVRRFLVLSQRNRLLCTDYYSLEWIVRANAVLDVRADAIESQMAIYVSDTYPMPEYITPQRVYACLSRARHQAVLVCETRECNEFDELSQRATIKAAPHSTLHYQMQDVFSRQSSKSTLSPAPDTREERVDRQAR